MDPNSMVEQAVREIKVSETSRNSAIFTARKSKDAVLECNEFAKEKKLYSKIPGKRFSGKIAGVDSGFEGRSLYSVELVLVRTAGCVFHLKNSVLEKAEYYPHFFSFPKPYISNVFLQKEDLNTNKSLSRLKDEISTAREIIGKFRPEYMLIDGSLVPQQADKPRNDSSLEPFYRQVMREFELLYSSAEKNSCTLVGCVNDSRGNRFMEILQQLGLSTFGENSFMDSIFLDGFLDEGERSCAFRYSKDISEHPVLRDFSNGKMAQLYVSYLKPSEYDRVLRTEFFCTDETRLAETADKIASVILELSKSHREFAFPSVLLEADVRARLNETEIQVIHDKILDKLGVSFRMRLRRDSKPF